MDPKEFQKERMRTALEADIDNRVKRGLRTSVHPVIPYHYFSLASSECRDLFIDGRFYGCISLCQAMVEALIRFLCKTKRIASGDVRARISKLFKNGVISLQCRDACKMVHANDRNTYHHLNEDIETDYEVLMKRAEECVNALFQIESEVFAYTLQEGKIVPKHPEYWPLTGPNTGAVFIRAHH
jgi:hypothetical protein